MSVFVDGLLGEVLFGRAIAAVAMCVSERGGVYVGGRVFLCMCFGVDVSVCS